MTTTHLPELLLAPLRDHARSLERLRDRAPRDLARLAARPGVSVIIPIYGAPAALARCLASIRACGAPEGTELVLVDDHSADPEVDRICAEFAQNWPRTRLLRNTRNLGFVCTVNHGMREAAPEHDVLLLNSDTEVTPGWLTRMSLALHLDERTASVCALSNAAGFFTVSGAHADHELPEGVTSRMAQRALSFVSERELPEVPSTSGFCMLIRRAAIRRVGYFDSKLFLRGYGEENDWNERALGAGFVHRADDSRFVHHARGLSFGGARAELKRKNSRVLQALHPAHADRLRAIEKNDPLASVRARYVALSAHLASASASERAAFFDAPTTLVVGTDPPHGLWSEIERRISLTWGPRPRVDLFGAASASLGDVDPAAVAFELAHRWEPTRLVAAEPAVRAQLAELARIFAGSVVTSTP